MLEEAGNSDGSLKAAFHEALAARLMRMLFESIPVDAPLSASDVNPPKVVVALVRQGGSL